MEGNYDGLFQTPTGQLDPNINSAFDYADFLINADGLLTNDRTHQFKFDGSYELHRGLPRAEPRLLDLLRSGMPLNAYGYSPGYENWEYLPRAARIARPRSGGVGSRLPASVSDQPRRHRVST